jgi:hypothetical protein
MTERRERIWRGKTEKLKPRKTKRKQYSLTVACERERERERESINRIRVL